MILVLEMSRPWLWRPFIWSNRFMGKQCWRFGWGYWAIALYLVGFYEFCEYQKTGNTEWRDE